MTPEQEAQRTYQREWMRTYRRLVKQKAEAFRNAKFTLHDYSCPYPTRGCRCRAIVVR